MRLRASEASLAELGAEADACPWATFFQTPAWLTRAAALRPNHALRVHRLEVGGTTVLWPLFERRKDGVLDVRGNVAGVYGGWVARSPTTSEEARALLAWLDGHAGPLRFRPSPFLPGWTPGDLDRLGALEDEMTYLMDLRRTSAEAWTGYAAGHRRNIHKAQRLGAKTRVASSPEDWAAFGRLMEESQARWGTPASGQVNAGFLASFMGVPGARLYVTDLDGSTVAAALHFVHRGHMLAWKMGTSEMGQDSFAWKALVHDAIEDARRSGWTWYDLNVSGGHAGTDRWKQLLGGEPRLSPMVRRDSRPTLWDRWTSRPRPEHPPPAP